MSNLRLVYLESDNVDAVVSVLRELQYMPTAFAPALVSAPAAVDSEPEPEPEPQPPARSVAEPPPIPSPEPERRAPRAATSGVAGTVLAAFEETNRPDRRALARKLYGDDSSNSIQRVGRTVYNLCQSGRLKAIGDGAYKVVG